MLPKKKAYFPLLFVPHGMFGDQCKSSPQIGVKTERYNNNIYVFLLHHQHLCLRN